jgi:Protein of unknown function (DUF2971).
MEENIHDYLYHYTSINTLGLILKGKKIRFNNLCDLDDLDEGTYAETKWGKYCFVSSWTYESEESIQMWNMYTDNMNGVRIKLKRNPFKSYKLPYIGSEKGFVDSIVPFEEIYNDHYSVASYLRSKLLNKVIYSDISFIDSIKKNKPLIEEGDNIRYNVENVGINKNKYWDFQKEYRYILHIIPFGTRIHNKTEEEIKKMINNLKSLVDLPFNDYYLDLEFDAFDGMEILLGPKTNEIDYEIVELLLKKYNIQAKIITSCLKNRIR